MIESMLPALKEAVGVFRREYGALQSRWDTISTNEEVEQLEKDQEAVRNYLRLAFYNVTSDINSKENCMRLHTDYIIDFAIRNAGVDKAGGYG